MPRSTTTASKTSPPVACGGRLRRRNAPPVVPLRAATKETLAGALGESTPGTEGDDDAAAPATRIAAERSAEPAGAAESFATGVRV